MIFSVFNLFLVSFFFTFTITMMKPKRIPTTYPFAWLNLDFLNFSAHSGVVLSVEEVEAGLKGLKVDQQLKNSTPFMAEHLEETLSAVTSNRHLKKDGDMTAFNKLVNTMKASGTLPSQPKVSVSIQHKLQPFLLFPLSVWLPTINGFLKRYSE